jgi:hypothetical protein
VNLHIISAFKKIKPFSAAMLHPRSPNSFLYKFPAARSQDSHVEVNSLWNDVSCELHLNIRSLHQLRLRTLNIRK